jgi:hypothetical protein
VARLLKPAPPSNHKRWMMAFLLLTALAIVLFVAVMAGYGVGGGPPWKHELVSTNLKAISGVLLALYGLCGGLFIAFADVTFRSMHGPLDSSLDSPLFLRGVHLGLNLAGTFTLMPLFSFVGIPVTLLSLRKLKMHSSGLFTASKVFGILSFVLLAASVLLLIVAGSIRVVSGGYVAFDEKQMLACVTMEAITVDPAWTSAVDPAWTRTTTLALSEATFATTLAETSTTIAESMIATTVAESSSTNGWGATFATTLAETSTTIAESMIATTVAESSSTNGWGWDWGQETTRAPWQEPPPTPVAWNYCNAVGPPSLMAGIEWSALWIPLVSFLLFACLFNFLFVGFADTLILKAIGANDKSGVTASSGSLVMPCPRCRAPLQFVRTGPTTKVECYKCLALVEFQTEAHEDGIGPDDRGAQDDRFKDVPDESTSTGDNSQ